MSRGSPLRRPCLGAVVDGRREACGIPAKGGRCPRHAAMMTDSARGYDRQYRQEREAMLKERPFCELQLPGCTVWATEADHPVALIMGGDKRQVLVPSCKHCNSSKGAR